MKKKKNSKYWVHTFTPSINFSFQTKQVQNYRGVLVIGITIVTKGTKVQQI
jgi:hypothetical protein